MPGILLVDDHHVILDGMKHLLEGAGYNVLATANSCASAREKIGILHANIDILLVDIQLPDGSGIDLSKWVFDNYPDIKVIALSMLYDPLVVIDFINHGGSGFISKADEFSNILEAIQYVIKGDVFLSESLKKTVFSQIAKPRKSLPMIHAGILTKREKEILALIKDEQTIPEIALLLNIAESTVISHRKSLLSKLQARNTAGLINAIYTYHLLD